MLPLFFSAHPRSGCAGPMNAANILRALMPVRPWKPPVQVGNRAAVLQVSPLRGIAADRESCVTQLGTELIDWAATLCAGRVTRIADTLVPGAAALVLVPTVHATLRDALRGDLLGALQRLPLASLALAPAARLLAETLGEGLRERVQNVPDHEPLVVALAACALLHHAQRGAPGPGADSRMAAVVWLRRARALLDAWSALRQVCNAHSAPAAPGSPANSAVDDHEERARVWLENVFPSTAAARYERSATCPEAENAFLPGVCAGRRKGARPRPRPAGAAKPAARPASGAGPAHSHRRLAASRLKLQPPPSNKESTAVAKGKPGKAPAGATGVRRKGHARGRTAVADGTHTHADATHLSRGNPRTPPPVQDPASQVTRHCLPYQTARAVARQLLHGATDARGLTYCVRPAQAANLAQAVEVRVPDTAGAVHWVRAHLLPHWMPPSPQDIPVVRHATMRAFHTSAEPPASLAPLGREEPYSTMTVAVSPPHPVRHPPRTPAPHLDANTFRFLQVPQWDGTNRTVLTYFLNEGGEVCRGVKVGWMDVTEDDLGRVSVADTQSGYVLSGATLECLAQGVQRISGRGLLAGAEDGSLVTRAQNLQVSEEATWCGRKPYDVQAHNPELSLLRVRTLRIPGVPSDARLFPGSFMIVGDTLIYHDPGGRVGTLALQSGTGGQHTLTLLPAEGNSQRFLVDYGLRSGVDYEALELIELLEEQDMVFLPPPV